ncbi:MAG TPA: hypothetical protein VLF60_02075 [Candidatus Saccharimonadales bacterium]|nr:hypothetical protein [Candidatus Saccharimonadales bacterium]
MSSDIHKQLLAKKMSRKEFLQLAGGSAFVLFGLSNFLPLFRHYSKTQPKAHKATADNNFGTRKFGV